MQSVEAWGWAGGGGGGGGGGGERERQEGLSRQHTQHLSVTLIVSRHSVATDVTFTRCTPLQGIY